MEFKNYLSGFFDAIAGDARISVTHIGVYAALLQIFSRHDFQNPIHVFSSDVMGVAKISSVITYCKTVRELSEYGYIKYEPSFSRMKGSKIIFLSGRIC